MTIAETAPTNFQNVHHQIDRQNTQIEPNSTDQNPPLTESDHSDNVKNGEEQNIISSNEKRKIADKFHAIKEEFKQKGKYSKKEWNQIEEKIAKHLKIKLLQKSWALVLQQFTIGNENLAKPY
uniref:Myb-like domain-containing protein n=1 Tax=Globodera rostochiensis TaxID=31243 RepID=A0A914HP89_GLORO